MKTIAIGFGKWIVLGVIFAAIGLLMALPAGRRRGTRTYGWRIALWAFAITVMAGAPVLFSASNEAMAAVSQADEYEDGEADKPQPKCYKPIMRKTCYVPVRTCYAPMPEPPDPPPPPDDDDDDGDDDGKDGKTVEPGPGIPDPPVMCYKPMPMPTCYEPMPPDPDPDPEPKLVPESEPEPDSDDPSISCYFTS
jgi:hypothetical protein